MSDSILIETRSKRKTIIIISGIIFVLLLAFGARSAILYIGNMIASKDYFGDEYIQIIYPTSLSDYIIANDVLEEADEAFSTITTDEEAEDRFKELGRFCITDEDAISEKHDLSFICAHFDDSNGYIWVKYDSQAYDISGNTTFGSHALSRWELVKTDDKWTVISINEHS